MPVPADDHGVDEAVADAVQRELDVLLGDPPRELVEIKPSDVVDLDGVAEEAERLMFLRLAAG